VDEGLSLVETFANGYGLFVFQQEYSNDGLGGVGHYYNVGASYEIPELPFVFLRFDVPMAGASFAPSGGPQWRWEVQWITPFFGSQHRIENYAQIRAATTVSVGARSGQSIFATNCSPCHGANGQGLVGPAFAGNKDITAADPSAIITTVKHGKDGMPEWGDKLSSTEIASVLTYIRSQWGNSASQVTQDQVSKIP
jgi:mono/diheme cytochrome c family protein